jgi:hypothetical protein
MPSPPPPPPRVDELSGKNFLGHLKKNIVQRNVAEKKMIASNWGMKKIRAQKNCPTPLPPHKYLMVRPLLANFSVWRARASKNR